MIVCFQEVAIISDNVAVVAAVALRMEQFNIKPNERIFPVCGKCFRHSIVVEQGKVFFYYV